MDSVMRFNREKRSKNYHINYESSNEVIIIYAWEFSLSLTPSFMKAHKLTKLVSQLRFVNFWFSHFVEAFESLDFAEDGGYFPHTHTG